MRRPETALPKVISTLTLPMAPIIDTSEVPRRCPAVPAECREFHRIRVLWALPLGLEA
jgi:hypothetical protein